MKYEDHQLIADETDIENFKKWGFEVSCHTPYYMNGITVKLGDITLGFHCWRDDLQFWIDGNEQIPFKSKEQVEILVDIMKAVVKFNSLNK